MNSPLVRLQRFLMTYYDVAELSQLAFTLNLKYEDLGGDQRLSARSRELVLAIGRQQRWSDLLTTLQEERPQNFAQAQFSTLPTFIKELSAEFAALPPDQKQGASTVIQQKAGDKSLQVGQNFGQIVVQHPQRYIFLLTLFGMILIGLLFSIWFISLSEPDDIQVSEPPTNNNFTPPSPADRQLEALVLPALADAHLEDVAANGEVVWFGAEDGLFVWHLGDQDARRVVDGKITAVAAQNNHSVWFGMVDDTGVKLGLYQLDNNAVEWLTMTLPLNPTAFITAIVAGPDDLVWIGDSTGNIYRLRASTKEGNVLPTPSDSPVNYVYSLALEPNNPNILWVVGSNSIYRWQSDQWVTVVPANEIASGIINAVAGGMEQRGWFGHANGVTLFQDRLNVNVRQECAVPELPSTLITDLVTAKGGKDLWLVSRGGLAWLDARLETTLPDNCDTWHWNTWSEDGFWQTATEPGVFRLAVDEDAEGEPLVWVIRQGTGRVRWLSKK